MNHVNSYANCDYNGKEKDLKVVIVGDGDVGKTSMLISYTTQTFPSSYVPTVFDNYVVTFVVDDIRYNMLLVDTAGQEEYRSIINLAFQDVDVFIICFSLINKTSIMNVETYWSPIVNQQCPKVPIVLVGTKSDLAKQSSSNTVSHTDAIKVAKKIAAVKYLECSALTQEGLKQIFDCAITTVIEGWKHRKKVRGCLNKMCIIV